MKKTWSTKKLSETCFFQEGPGIRKYEYKKDGYPIINVRCVQDGFIDLSKSQSVDFKFISEKWSHFQIEEGDILFTTSGTIGRTAMVFKKDLPLLMNTSVVRFRPLDEHELDRSFLAWLLRSPNFVRVVKSYSSGTAQKNVGPSHLKLIDISYPNIPEQKRIAKILDETFEKLEKVKKNTENSLACAKEISESCIQNLFHTTETNCSLVRLDSVSDFQNGFAFKSSLFTDSGLPVLRISNIQNNGISYKKLTYFKKENYKENLDKYRVLKGDLVIAMSGATTGKIAISDTSDTFYLNQRVGKFIPKKDLYKDYLYHFLTTKVSENLKISAGSAQPNLSTEQIKNICIPIPSLVEQKAIVKRLDALSEKTKKLEEIYKKKLENIEELKKSILQKAFSGEL